MSRWFVSGLMLGTMCLSLVADDPKPADLAKKPQWQRMLAGEDAKTAAKLEKRIAELEAADDYGGAIQSAEELLQLRNRRQGADHHEVKTAEQDVVALKKVAALEAKERRTWRQVTSRWREAEQLRNSAKYAAALTIEKEILEIRRKVLGEDHPDTAGSYGVVAFILNAQGKAAEAGPLYQKALEIRRKVLGEEHPDTASSYNNVARNLDAQGKAVEAGPLLQKALEIRRKVLGEEHPDTASSYNNVAFNLNAQGKAAEAGPLYQKALDIRRKVLGEEHPATATSYNNVASNLDDLGKGAEAGPLYQKALDIHRKVLGENHPDTVTCYNNVAGNQLVLGDIGAATATLTDGIRAYESSRLVAATGIERGNLTQFNPRLLLASLMAVQEPRAAWRHLELSLARGLFDQQSSATRLTAAEQRTQLEARQGVAARQPRILNLVSRGNRSSNENQELHELLNQRRQQEETIARPSVLDSERSVEPGERIQAALPADAAIVYWLDVSDSTARVQEHWACVVRNAGEPKWVRLPGTGDKGAWAKTDSELATALRLALQASSDPKEYEKILDQLKSRPALAQIVKAAADSPTVMLVRRHG